MKKIYLLCLIFICKQLVLSSQVSLSVIINSGTSGTSCTDGALGGAPEPQWAVDINSQGYIIYPSAGICYVNTPNTQFYQTYNCTQNYPATLSFCYQAFEDDGSACIPSKSCLAQICQNFPTPAPGSQSTYTLAIPNCCGNTSWGNVNFTILSTGSFLNSSSSLSVSACNSYSFGTQTYTSSGVYTKTLVNVNGCDSLVTLNLTINPTPTITVNSGTICSGNSFSIIPSGASTYTIQGGNTNVSPSINSTYTVNGTSAEGCISANTATANLIVNTTPTVSVNSGTICSGNSFSIIPSGANTYTIQGGITNVSPLTNSTYTVKGTATNGCISINTATSNLTVNTTPTVSVNNGTICSGNSFSIIPSGANTYTIQGGNTNVSPLTNSTYTVKGTATNGCVSVNTATSNLTVNTTPTVSVNNGTICTGNSFSIIPSGASTYTIQGGNTNVSPSINSTYTINGTSAEGCISANTATANLIVNTTPTVSVNSGTICSGNSFSILPSGANTYTIQGGSTYVSPLTNSTYTVNGTATNGCISINTATSNLTVNTTPTVSVNNGTICSGSSFSIIPSGANTYTIQGGNTNVSPLTNSTYTVKGTATNGCVSVNTATSNLTVNITPTITVSDGLICAGQSYSITPNGADTYTFSSGSNIVSPNITTTYSISGTSSLGCLASNTTICTITVVATPTITVNNGAICFGQTFSIVPSGAATYTYSNGSSTVAPITNSTYSVTGSVAPGCLATNTAICSVTVNPLPTIAASSNATLICKTESATITASGAITYTWSNNTFDPIIIVSPSISTTYTVIGTDANDCKNSATITQNVSECIGTAKLRQPEALLNVFPNPSNGIYTIDSGENLTISVYDAIGKLILTEKISEGKHKIDLSAFNNGLYTLKAENATHSKTIKLIKK
jgi:aspartate 1-decarboxylase